MDARPNERRSALRIEYAMSTATTRTRRPRPKLVTLTDSAAERVSEILAERGEGYLRVGVKNGGCAGMEYLMDYVAERRLPSCWR